MLCLPLASLARADTVPAKVAEEAAKAAAAAADAAGAAGAEPIDCSLGKEDRKIAEFERSLKFRNGEIGAVALVALLDKLFGRRASSERS